MRHGLAGFTLLEVLIALAIVAIGLSAALRASGAGSDSARAQRDYLLALWLAENVVAERAARREWPEPGTRERSLAMAGQEFRVTETVAPTANPRFRRLDVVVRLPQEAQHDLRRLTVFLLRPD